MHKIEIGAREPERAPSAAALAGKTRLSITALAFEGLTWLDLVGPCDVLSRAAPASRFDYVSFEGGEVLGSHGLRIPTRRLEPGERRDLLLVPGGLGTRTLVDRPEALAALREAALSSVATLCVCTGSALLARTGLLDGRRATSNHAAWDWVLAQGPLVRWERDARWTRDGDFYTSAGVTAGIDLALRFVEETWGRATSSRIAAAMAHSRRN